MDSHDILAELRAPTRSLRHAIPGSWGAFLGLHDAAMEDGAVSRTVKEAVALAISVVKRCDGCIAYHARASARAGAAPEVVAELLGVALLMEGSTASVYAPRAWQAFNEFRDAAVAGTPDAATP